MSEADKAAEAHVKKLIEDYPEIYPTDLDRAKSHFLAGYAAAQRWRPIESAPRDKRILVKTGQDIYVAHWVKNPFTDDEAWLIATFGDDGDQLLVKPHEWMPLPAAHVPAKEG